MLDPARRLADLFELVLDLRRRGHYDEAAPLMEEAVTTLSRSIEDLDCRLEGLMRAVLTKGN